MAESYIESGMNLQTYFFDELSRVNSCSLQKIPMQFIYYTSRVLEQLAFAERLYGDRNSLLGIRLLEATELPKKKQQETYKEIGDHSLLLCGYFHESFKRKMIEPGYYEEVGKVAYSKLNALVPTLYDVENFYGQFAKCFGSISNLLHLIASKEEEHAALPFLITTKQLKAS